MDISVKGFGREMDIFLRDLFARWIFFKGIGREKGIKLIYDNIKTVLSIYALMDDLENFLDQYKTIYSLMIMLG
jgi:hypothetical protein